MNKDRWISVILFVFAIFMLHQTTKIQAIFAVSSAEVGPKLFPAIACFGLMICCIGKFLASKDKKAKLIITKKGWMNIAVVIAIFALYILSMKYFGYLLSTPIMLFVLVKLFGCGRQSKWWTIATFSVVTTAVNYILFQKIMNVMLPAGKLIKFIL